MLKNKLFFYEDIFLFSFIQWNIWIYFNANSTVKEIQTNNYRKFTSKVKKIPQTIIELMIGLFRIQPNEIECLAISPRATLSIENTVRGPRYLQPLTDYTFEELQKYTKMLALDVCGLGKEVFDPVFLYRHLKRDVKSVPYSYYISSCRLLRRKMIQRKVVAFSIDFEKDWTKLVGNPEFQQEVKRVKKMRPKFSVTQFKLLLKNHFVQKIKEIIYADYALDRINPKYLFIVNEYGNMPLIYMARKKGLKTYGLQHGVIHTNHPGYIYPNEFKGQVPLCDVHFVFGNYERTLLTESSIFDKNQVDVIGNPRMTNLSHHCSVYSHQIIRKQLGISSNKKIILYASSGNYGSATKELFNINDRLFEDFASLEPEYTLVIKMHPAETNFTKYHDEAKKYGVTDFILVRDYDLYALLYISDCLLGVISTVMSEAVAFKKRIIVYSNNVVGNQIEYMKWGVAVSREDYNSLKEAIDFFSLNGAFKENIDKNRDKFIEQFFYKIDGKSVKRILSRLDSEMELLA
ncbi:CDP-glycerol glycerophosphotransferase, TagB/SpsB family [Desulfatibacillum alkenivorans DSM 16219]|uniref:CDP-glycerol glycerophosphotransferase, TagB/SpsB family n=1 Tax=Desulfatibacillum alkenivorans DSM 16219 TaxID=1121393 RepID=A0A1M6UG94_9BACT|nr:CDP-glycerol glycerophosphotransferase, TagB/SpsB family [Desulfatibacillum alkenivorans DSM 16219]